jgi:hypothetical protein
VQQADHKRWSDKQLMQAEIDFQATRSAKAIIDSGRMPGCFLVPQALHSLRSAPISESNASLAVGCHNVRYLVPACSSCILRLWALGLFWPGAHLLLEA